MKYYAVQNGRKPGVYTSWEECKKQVHGFPNARYKAFTSFLEAEDFCWHEEGKQSAAAYDCVAYVDGSYDDRQGAYSYAAVIFYQKQKYTFSAIGKDDLLAMRNVAGEIRASMEAMRFACDHDCDSLLIVYDYAGIENWCTRVWKTNKSGTREYVKFYEETSKKVNISFQKVKAHSHHIYNDEADQLAKKALYESL